MTWIDLDSALCGNAESGTRMSEMRKAMSLLAHLDDVDGCITGSSVAVVLDGMDDVEEWESAPDVDLFAYSRESQIVAIMKLRELGYKPGKGSEASRAQEEWKISRILHGRNSKDNKISSVTLTDGSVKVNVTFKAGCTTLARVLESFDMTCIMAGFDIGSGVGLDLRGENRRTATRNPLRSYECSMWNVAHWVRQWDRVLKYYDRGFDTRPMARFYLEAIDEVLAEGRLFTSESYNKMYDDYSREFAEMRDRIETWMEEHGDD